LPDEKLEKLHLIDGDKMIALYAIFFSKALEKLSKATQELNKTGLIHVNEDFSKWNIGLVQTAYANGSSTSFIRNNLKL
jgi:phosphoacetylglucosamine mutase